MTQPDYIRQIHAEAEAAAHVLADAAKLSPGQLVIIGCSTSEVIGQRIGTSGTIELASALYAGLELLRTKYGVQLAYQCCEHLNRALVVERTTCETLRLDEVSAVPVPRAGGSMAAAAYTHFASPCLVETISADAGIDIGETLIGMHLKRVAVPLRTSVRSIGAARVTMAMTRPKLIGGERAVYHPSDTNAQQLSCE
ncbi:TIGR01440 family protein [Paenibacillus sp. UMB4589-SE434]|uniref:TIGR01440 family protein n=1 Tax=Paenibacillus sp. UMB4589-SE434 TaxID=3046314 RepID=UPI0025503D92|nr:TIGR01440 family protein [Paenibacillus sp. UMB4589-SE434]MDK8181568.1 TIGR01440 family protein [Paenibacillus sp. UMB4589-SE434]